MNDIIAHLSAYEVVELIDLRDVSRDLFAERENEAAAHPWLMIEVTLTKAGRDALLTAKLVEVARRRLYWSHAETVDCREGALPSLTKLTELANQVVDAALMAVLRRKEGAIPNGASAPQSMIGVLHQLFSMSRDGQRSVRSYLSSHEGLSHSALANACYALSIANTLGEDGHRTADLRAARERARIAVTLDPQNALVLAMTGHVFGFALREFETGEELTGLACRLAPSLPQAWDFAAMNAIYRGQVEKACEFSQRAAKLGYFSAYRPLYLSSMAISATLAGNHKAAVDLSQSVLSRLPGFLGVMRHSVVSLCALDRERDAHEMIAQIRALDPRFCGEEIRNPRYPVPSEASRELIGEALRGFRSTH
ncbi:hypothetical protein So717_01120 [Roseobacter cerasinus]|uniref:Uncharacterized protein n=1 Tax=Roseobacter cerasinus TaxID=2602289 RepID=A0A640VJW1_9RHOB|nr:hypothetical protein So717_01120 [Roseobacter cerasinus]